MRRRWCWRQQLSSSPSAMLHGLSSLTWLPKPPQTTCLPSSLPSTSRIITQGSGRLYLPACSTISGICLSIWFWFWITFLTLKFLTWPDLPVVFMSTKLSDLVVHRAGSFRKWQMFAKWKRHFQALSSGKSFDTFKHFVKKITCICQWLSGWNSRLIWDFVGVCKGEDMKQNLMLVARDNRKKFNWANVSSTI